MKSHTLIVCLAVMTLSGCATGCREACLFGFGPGNFIFDRVADSHDSQDPCNITEFSRLTGARLKPAGYTYKDIPWYCGRGSRSTRITDPNGKTVGYIK